MVFDHKNATDKQVHEELYKHEIEELEEICEMRNITGKAKEEYIKRSLEQLYNKDV